MKTPADLKTPAERAAYRRGWQDRAEAGGSKGGSVTSAAKAAAVRANGAKGGRPRKDASQRVGNGRSRSTTS